MSERSRWKRRAPGAWLITGAASGLGRELARQLAPLGQPLLLWDLDEAGLEATVSDLNAQGRAGAKLLLQRVDVRDPASLLASLEAARAELGPIAHALHCAGVLHVGPAATMDPAAHRQMLEVNTLGTIHLCQAVLPHLEEALRLAPEGTRSTLMLTASVAGLRGFPQLAGYSASKFAVVGFAQALRAELEGGRIDLRVLCPPPVDTPMVRSLPELPPVYKLSKMFTAEQIVGAALRDLESGSLLLLVDRRSKLLSAVDRAAPQVVDLLVKASDRLP